MINLDGIPEKNLKAVNEFIKSRANKYKDKEQRERTYRVMDYALEQLIYHNNPNFYNAIKLAERIPVNIETFMTHPDYMGGMVKFWPSQVRDLKKMCPDTWVGEKNPIEVILTGATGIGKTFRADVALLYTLYVLCCFKNPHKLFGLNKAKAIAIFATAADKSTARVNVYEVVREWFLEMPIIKKMGISYDTDKETELHLTDLNIIFKPVNPRKKAIQGYDVIAMSVEEANSMEIIRSSKKAMTGEGDKGGMYDQAQTLISEAIGRRDSRFYYDKTKPRVDVGAIYVVSSANHTNDYVSKRVKLIEKTRPDHEYLILNQRRWDVLPLDQYDKETFPVLVGCEQYAGKILTQEEIKAKNFPKNSRIEDVPTNWKYLFQADFDTSQKDIIGVSSATVDGFIKQPEFIQKAIAAFENLQRKNITDKQNYDLMKHAMPRIIPENLPIDRDKPRIIHIDQGISGDKCGIAMVKLVGKINKQVNEEYVEQENFYDVEMAISIKGSKTKEVDIEDVRNLAMSLKLQYGLNIIAITYDQYQSKESLQKLKKAGFRSKQFSSMKTPESYDYFKKVIYSERCTLPNNSEMVEEILHLQKDSRTGKVDHAPGFSNDICDAIVSAMYQFTTMRGFRQDGSLTDVSGEEIRQQKRPDMKRRNMRRK